MQTKIKHITLISAFLTLMSAFCLSSCINDNEVCPPDVEESSSDVYIKFTMVTRNAKEGKTRALNPVSPTEVGFAAENYLDLDNLTFLLFDESGVLRSSFNPDITGDPSSDYVKYEVSTKLSEDFFYYSATGGDITFSIGILGNYSLLDGRKNFNFINGRTMGELFEPSNVPAFNIPSRNNDRNSWIPSINGGNYTDANGIQIALSKAHIPMAGLQTFTVTEAALRSSTQQSPLQLSPEGKDKEINMLRALAKIEIVDVIPADQNCRISKVELIGHIDSGSMLPTLDQWQTNGTETQYATIPSLPQGTRLITGEASARSFFADTYETETLLSRNEEGMRTNSKVYSCYLTEVDVNKHVLTGNPIWMRVTLANFENGETYYNDYRVNLAPYSDNLSVGPMNVVRNNIYRYKISASDNDMNIKLEVLPWVTETVNWDYQNTPGYEQELQWQNTGYSNIDKDNTEITYSDGELVGTFKFSQPLGATWHAMLVQANENTLNNAFVFVDGDEVLDTHTSGTIGVPTLDENGDPVYPTQTIRIKANYPPNEVYSQEMRLLFTIRTQDGRTMSVNLMPQGSKNKYWTIVQPPKL